MSWFLASIYDRFTRDSEEACGNAWRAELLGGLRGDVLEVGAGTGANFPHYPADLASLVATEPDRHMARRLRDKHGDVRLVDAVAEDLPMAAESFDAVVSTLVLCSVKDLDRALSEMHRVLRPGGKLVFLEHVAASDDPGRLKWQRRIEPVWKRIAGNCHLTRRTDEAIERAGFEIESITRESIRKAMPIVRPSVRGTARKLPAGVG